MSTRHAPFSRLLAAATTILLAAGLIAFAHGARAQGETPKESVRTDLAKPLQAAQELLNNKKYAEALAKVGEADAISGKNPYESFLVERYRGAAAIGAGDNALAAKSFEAAVAYPQIGAKDAKFLTEALVSIHYHAKDFRNVVTWGEKALKLPDVPRDIRLKVAQSYYFLNDYARAASDFGAIVTETEKAGQTPPEDQLRVWASAELKRGNNAGVVTCLEKLVTYYPKNEYWSDLIYRVETQKNFAERLVLDSYRLKFALGLLNAAAEYSDMADLANNAGFPVEALRVLDQGFESGALGKESPNDRQKKMRDAARREVEEEKKRSAKGATTPKTGIALLNNGYDLVLKGDVENGLQMMERGVKSADLKYPEDAKLRLGIARAISGQSAKALEVLKTVQGDDGARDLARLWSLYAGKQKS